MQFDLEQFPSQINKMTKPLHHRISHIHVHYVVHSSQSFKHARVLRRPIQQIVTENIFSFFHTSSSCSSMFGIPFEMVNFLPVSGHTKEPSQMSTSSKM